MDNLSLDYFYGSESEMFTFYRIPKLLFTDDRFKELSSDSKILYGLLLDRMSLSMKNGWIDGFGRVFIYFSMEEVMEYLNCSKNKAVKILAELDEDSGIGLIERVKQGQGKPAIIYVKNFQEKEQTVSDSQKREVLIPKKGKSRIPKIGSLESQILNPNDNNINNTKYNNTKSNLILSDEGCDSIESISIEEQIKVQIEYDALIAQFGLYSALVDDVCAIMVEIAMGQAESIIISGNRYPYRLVQERFSKLTFVHVEYVIQCLKQNTTKVKNIKRYMIAALFNASSTMNSYYVAEVNHDMVEYATRGNSA